MGTVQLEKHSYESTDSATRSQEDDGDAVDSR